MLTCKGRTPRPQNTKMPTNPDFEHDVQWTWNFDRHIDFVKLLNDERDVKFHRNNSSGTAVVRGTQLMIDGQFFWEVKMISPVYGTDMMVGIGTEDVDLSPVQNRFISFLGMDDKSWGLSYTGLFHHNGESHIYGSQFTQGSVIGMHLDMWNGTLSFYKNKKHLGIACRGLKGKTLYAMACSTAACSGMRILRTCSFSSSLQFLCCSKLRELIPDDKDVLKEISLPPGLKVFLENNLSWLLDSRFSENVLYPTTLIRGRFSNFFESTETLDELHFTKGTAEPDDNNDTDFASHAAIVVGSSILLRRCYDSCCASHNPTSPVTDNLRLPVFALQDISVEDIMGEKKGLDPKDEKDVEFSGYEDFFSYKELGRDYSKVTDEDDMKDNDSPVESEAKRRRRSYNYCMALSDPDSD
ncbi:SPRY domain-containing SOCS box protein 3 [Caerostris extrusa]|uniref:SPRY domain-containing SOCS box protein 3 n=1 Tax=Caerostris extrusa TaxID=172846 RepID=A0AAV4NYQ3_CAEEX|nr:SPRY domain-containing SOCS box protein 3 [Caerostris extrusa]